MTFVHTIVGMSLYSCCAEARPCRMIRNTPKQVFIDILLYIAVAQTPRFLNLVILVMTDDRQQTKTIALPLVHVRGVIIP